MEKVRLIALCAIMMGAKSGGNVAPGETFTADADDGENLVKRKFARELTDAEEKAAAQAEADDKAKAEADKAAAKGGKAPAAPPVAPITAKLGDEKKQ